MPSPSGIFVGMTSADILVIRTAALARITDGDFTQLSGAQKSSSKTYEMKPQDVLRECNYALTQLGVSGYEGPPQTVYQDFTGLRRMPNTVST